MSSGGSDLGGGDLGSDRDADRRAADDGGAGVARPPRALEWICAATLPGRQREVVLGDLAEEYAARARRNGPGAADRWYAREIWRSLGPTIASLPSHLLSPGRYRTEDLVTMAWFALVSIIVAAVLVASGIRPH